MLAEDIDIRSITDELAALRREVRVLRDKEEIRDLVYRYAFCADVDEVDLFLDTLTPDAVWTASGSFVPGQGLPGKGVFRGREEARAALTSPSHAAIANKEQHVMANLVIDVTGDTARAIGHLVLTVHNWGGFGLGTCRYVHMDFVRQSDGWRISALTFRETGDPAMSQYIVDSGLLERT